MEHNTIKSLLASANQELFIDQHRKLIYAENVKDIEEAFALLGEHNVAQVFGKDIFEQDNKMLYDLLAEEAAEWLQRKCDH